MATEHHDTGAADLRAHVLSIIETLENPPDCSDDGVPAEECGWTWDADNEVWRDDDGEECEAHPMSGMDYLTDALDIEYVVNGKGEYLGAHVLVAFGGPNIWIDTRWNVVRGAWWGDSFSAGFQDSIGLDDALGELWACR